VIVVMNVNIVVCVWLSCVQVEDLQVELANKEDSDPVSCSLASTVHMLLLGHVSKVTG